MDDTVLYTIGELARRTGLSVKTIRFYSDSGVVPPTDRTAAGYRRYDVTAIGRLELVRTLRELGAGLDEVQRFLANETTLSNLAKTHLELLEEQIRVLQTRRAVLRAVVKLDRSTEEVRLMHKLAQMSDEERNRLIDEFWDEVSGDDLNITPGFTEWLRQAKPNLPADPTAEQLEAWIELAELVREPDFRRAVRALYQEHSDRRDAGEALVADQEEAQKWWAVTDEARVLVESGTPPEGAEAQALATRMMALWGRADTAESRRELAEDYENRTDERMSRYWELLATINNWPKHPVTAATARWLAAALRVSND
ncbi:MerR family transcriptional regulator [Saccharopolyspora sp. ASAGF58]|uniref:MerR family transcriptional regulator n=1 Tax=Saccharopolyspora sp. ASAGF58 TaxID=2719023 RepID=UPI001440191C|nr:MerR family transcriptional regulator [Saccharopolyspora sp. ASAGF58]QIZ35573.1 MerR family transcriptional regulator [Saccharopolyspora sp. ASAGF58]